jgi:hypothetical protein
MVRLGVMELEKLALDRRGCGTAVRPAEAMLTWLCVTDRRVQMDADGSRIAAFGNPTRSMFTSRACERCAHLSVPRSRAKQVR